LKTNKIGKNIKKKLLNALIYILLVLIFLIPSLAFLFHEPIVQTLSGRFATYMLTAKIGNVISVDAVQIGLQKGITFKGIIIKDHRDSTMIQVDDLIAKPIYADWGLFGIRFSKIELDGAQIRLAKYKEDDDLNLILMINKFGSGDTISTKSIHKKPGTFKLRSSKLILRNSLFQYYDEQMDLNLNSKMNYSNIVFDSINLEATKFAIINDSLNFIIDKLSTNERSGIKISDMSTRFSISGSGLKAEALLMQVNNSTLDLDFGFDYNSYQSYRYFIDSVKITASIRPSTLNLSDLGFFTPAMDNLPSAVGITGDLRGVISDFSGQNVKVHYGNQTRVSLDGRIRGLPDFFGSYITADVSEINTTSCELNTLYLPIKGHHLDLRNYFKCNKDIKLNGKFRGYYNDFKTNFILKSHEGSLRANLLYTDIPNDTVHFEITAKGDTIQLGKLLDQRDFLGKTSFDINAKGRGKNWSDIKIKSGGTLKSTDLMGYNYSRIRYSGKYKKDRAEGNIVVGDHNLMLNADVTVGLTGILEMDITADIRRADLENLKIWQGYNFSFSTYAVASIKGLEPDIMTGNVLLNNSRIMFGKDKYDLVSVALEKKLDDKGVSTIDLQSDYADLNLTGKYNISSFSDRLVELLNHYLRAIPVEEKVQYPEPEYADLNFTLHDDVLIKDHLVPGLSVSPNTNIQAHVDFNKYLLDVTSRFDEMNLNGILMKDNNLDINTTNDRLELNYSNSTMIFKDSTDTDKTVFGLDNFNIKTVALNDSLAYVINWNNKDSLIRNSGELEGFYKKTPTADIFKISHSDVVINDTAWGIDPANKVIIDSSGIAFKDTHIYGGKSNMNLEGKFPQKNGDSLIVTFDSWDLSNFDMLTKLWRFDLDGIVNGNFQYSLVNDNPVFVSDIVMNKLAMNKEYLGTAELFNTWNNKDESISLKSKVFREGSSGRGEVISIYGYYYPFKDDESLDLDISFNRLKINALEPFFVDFISQLEGVAAGTLKLKGSFDKPVLTGSVDMHRAQLLVNYLNTKYSFSNVINFEKDKISFDELVIYDTLGNFANVDGSLKHKYFRDTQFDVKISTDKLLTFNTSSKMNELYYGTAFTSGNMYISGNTKKINLDLDITTNSGTNVKLPLDYSVEISDKDYIVFIDHSDSLAGNSGLLDENFIEKSDNLDYNIDMNINITPKAKVTIFLPSDMGKIESEGRGNLKMQTNTSGDFSLIGDYVVEKGYFHFSLANLVNKRFDLVEGGRISWTGDPYTANVNIKGLYRVKTNLSSLGILIDSTSTYRNKVNVDCYVILKNQLLNPDIRFEILMPDLNPDLQRMVYAQLDTTNQAMMNQQMISLLVLGTFSYSNASNVSLSSSYYNVISNQLSNMLSKISDDFDIGVNYKPGDQMSQEEFDVALSTQLFDDRLMIDGHFGMTYDRSGQSASNIVGDVDIGYKLTEDGRWILKAFNHSNVNSWYNYSNYEKISPYTQGVGIAFRKDFTNISELFKRSRPKQNKEKDDKNSDAIKEEDQ